MRDSKKRILEASDEEGVLASDDSKEVEFEEGWGIQTNNYTRHLWNIRCPRINYDNPEHPTRKQEAKLPRAEIKQRRRKGGTPSTSPRALNNKHKHYN